MDKIPSVDIFGLRIHVPTVKGFQRKETYGKAFRMVRDVRGSSQAVSLVKSRDKRMGNRVVIVRKLSPRLDLAIGA